MKGKNDRYPGLGPYFFVDYYSSGKKVFKLREMYRSVVENKIDVPIILQNGLIRSHW